MTEGLTKHVEAAAQAIAGEAQPSAALRNGVERAAYELSHSIPADARVPRRSELTQQISAVRDASKLISVLLFPFMHGGSASLLLSDHLLREGEHRLEYEGELYRLLTDVAERCEATLIQLPKGPGQGRAVSGMVKDNTANADTKCAIAVQALWKSVHGRLPGVNSDEAHRACFELWLAAGGRGTKLSGWVSDLREARKERHRREASILAGLLGVQGIHPGAP